MIKPIKNIVKTIIRWDARKFNRICSGVGLSLDYGLNKDAVRVLETVFKEREYAPYFPFYESVTVLDVGGHYGYFSFFAALNLSPKSKILSLEPSLSNFNIFKENLNRSSFKNINPMHCGLGAQTMIADLYGGRSYNHSIIKQAGQSKISSVQIFSLDDFIRDYDLKEIDFLKLDCEGAEYEILFNASKESFKKIKTISMEFHDQRSLGYSPNQIIEYLEGNNYKIVHFHYDTDSSLSNLNFGKIVATRVN